MSSQFSFLGRSSSLLGVIFYKLMLALIEMLAGALCLFGAFFARHPSLVGAIDQVGTTDHLDSFVKWLVHYLIDSEIGDQILLHIGLILIALGVLKLVLSVGLWFKSQKVRTAGMLLFSGLAAYSLYQLINDFSTIKAVALVSDVFFAYYFWKILPKYIKK